MLSESMIIKEARNLIKEDGFENLSMRKLADRLGVKAMSLYNHIRNKDELIDLLSDNVISEMYFPEKNSDWKSEMIKRAETSKKVLSENSWALMPLMSRLNLHSNILRYFDRSLSCLHYAGFTYPEADRILNHLDSYIYGYILTEQNFPVEQSDYVKTAESSLPGISEDEYPSIHGLSMELLSGKYDGKQNFMEGITTIMNGLTEKLLKK